MPLLAVHCLYYALFCGVGDRSDLTVGFALWDPAEPLKPGCSGHAPRPSDATGARQSDRARSKTRSRPPIRGLDGTSLRVVVVARGLRRSEWRRK